MTNRKISAALALTSIAAALLLIPAASPAATVVNGDFETGNLSGWQVYNSTTRRELVRLHRQQTPAAEKSGRRRRGEFEIIPIKPIAPSVKPLLTPKFPAFFPPPQGSWAAVNDERTPDTAILYQDIALEPYWTHQLTMTFYYHSFAPIFVPNPDTLALPGPGSSSSEKNQTDPAAGPGRRDEADGADRIAQPERHPRRRSSRAGRATRKRWRRLSSAPT